MSVTFSVDTLKDVLLLLENPLTDRDERPNTPGYLSLEHCVLVPKRIFGSQSNQWPRFHHLTPFICKQILSRCILISAGELIYDGPEGSLCTSSIYSMYFLHITASFLNISAHFSKTCAHFSNIAVSAHFSEFSVQLSKSTLL